MFITKTALLSSFRNYYSHINNDFFLCICGNYHTCNVEVLYYLHAKFIDVNIFYDIIDFHTASIYWII